MSCAEFERDLAHLMGAEPGGEPAERANGIRRLREHVDGCDACGATAGLLTILELPEGFIERPIHELTDWDHYHEPGDSADREWVSV